MRTETRGTQGRPDTQPADVPVVVRYRFTATPATRSAFKLRAGFCGAGGSGKSYSALAVASRIAERLSLSLYAIDSENGSLLKYAKSKRTGRGFDFMHVPMPPNDYSPQAYSAAIDHCIGEGAGVVLIDSLSHEWEGPRGVLEQVDEITEAAGRRSGGNASAFSSGWKEMTPIHTRLIQQILSCDAHVIFTLRAKVKYDMRKDDRGRMKPEKVGEGPVQRAGIEYEPDIFCWLADSILTVDKTRCDRLDPLSTWPKPGAEFADVLVDWIDDVEDPLALMLADAIVRGKAAAEAKDAAAYKAVRKSLTEAMAAKRVPQDKGAEMVAAFTAATTIAAEAAS